MFLAAPKETGIEISIPTIVATIVIHKLSNIPAKISSDLVIKSGGKKANIKFLPLGIPSRILCQSISVVRKTDNK